MKNAVRGVLREDGWPTLGSEAFHRLRQMIFDGTIASGDLVVEAKLVQVLKMSRTPIREALHRLEAEGVVTAVPHKGFRVVSVSDEDIAKLYQIRAVLEGLAAQSAATTWNRVDLGRLEDLYEGMTAACADGRDDELATLNREFHRAIAVASGNTYLQEILDNIKGVFERFRSSAVTDVRRRSQAHKEHGEMIEALRARDAERARKLAEAHVYRALKLGVAKQSASGPVQD